MAPCTKACGHVVGHKGCAKYRVGIERGMPHACIESNPALADKGEGSTRGDLTCCSAVASMFQIFTAAHIYIHIRT